ncbi:hypothetical protein [Ignicoccus hospitalis]|uniref:Uncharacterized protein n=1 Tax=Ignicoccus hospitalis (strain KIN4/I / DSM 18386 / JCM 14125) TaxID=453591 RepID=A8A8K0_IGNH4|nr:hypothetical protein [Ignicoccus hospitalis]ABU81252.1 hypothetical protein Igni_0068 [Ignicoccus hospitalis KIN4/I]HIH90934.1 hypothetical protein [Desulfurococcaceae archaeon]
MWVVVGNTMAARCVGGTVIDPVQSEPYPLRKARVGGKEVPMIPMLVPQCPDPLVCVEVKGDPVVLKDGSHGKACGDLRCQAPWPLRWKDMEKRYLVLGIKSRGAEVNIVPGRVKWLKEGKLKVGWKVIEFERLIWTAPYPYLASLLGLPSPKWKEATVALFSSEAEWSLAYHLADSNPFYSILRVGEVTWALGPGTFDALSAVKHLERKGYLKLKGNIVSYVIDYYALEEYEPSPPKWVELLGRTAEWKEKSLIETIC